MTEIGEIQNPSNELTLGEIAARLERFTFVSVMLKERQQLIDQGVYFQDPLVATILDTSLVALLYPELLPPEYQLREKSA